METLVKNIQNIFDINRTRDKFTRKKHVTRVNVFLGRPGYKGWEVDRLDGYLNKLVNE